MVKRRHWLNQVETAWSRRSVLWLRGVRRTGKTTLAQGLPDVEYSDCELPRVRRAMQDPESFLRGLAGKRIVLDEIHRLANPSELLPERTHGASAKRFTAILAGQAGP